MSRYSLVFEDGSNRLWEGDLDTFLLTEAVGGNVRETARPRDDLFLVMPSGDLASISHIMRIEQLPDTP